jgi:hypothetical protein
MRWRPDGLNAATRLATQMTIEEQPIRQFRIGIFKRWLPTADR